MAPKVFRSILPSKPKGTHIAWRELHAYETWKKLKDSNLPQTEKQRTDVSNESRLSELELYSRLP